MPNSSKKLRIAVIFGGRSAEHEVSLTSAQAILANLDPDRYKAIALGIDHNGAFKKLESPQLLIDAENPRDLNLDAAGETFLIDPKDSADRGFDVAFPIVHGTFGEDGCLQGLLELAQIPFVGPGVLSSSICMDKDISKRLLRSANLPIVPFFTVTPRQWTLSKSALSRAVTQRLDYPVFVKPANGGSSVGITKVLTEDKLDPAVIEAFKYDTKVILEKGVNAREIEMAVLGNEDPVVSVPGEVIPTHDFYSYEAKYLDAHGAQLKSPAELPPKILEQLRVIAFDAFHVLECEGMARVDFLLEEATGQIYINEINTLPGFTPISMYPKLFEASGIPFPKLIDKLIELAISRDQKRKGLNRLFQK